MKTLIALFAILLLAACTSSNTKKILIMSKGKATVNKDAKTITVESGGTSHEEQTAEFNDAGNLTLQITTDAGKMQADVPGNGYYVLNIKTDTIIGSYQNYNASSGQARVITQEDLKHRIDSVQQLLTGNTKAADKNYFILPGKALKITDNLEATLVGPFNSMTTLEQTGDKVPEVYKFYTTKDVRENLDRLQKMTIAPPSPNQ